MDKERIKQAIVDGLVFLKSLAECTETTLDDTIADLAGKIIGSEALLDLILDLLPFAVDAQAEGLVMSVGPTPYQRGLLEVEKIDWSRVIEFLMLLAQIIGPFLKEDRS